MNKWVDAAKRNACFEAVQKHLSLDSRVIGIGSGSTIIYCIPAIKEQAKRLGLEITACVPTSLQARQLILEAGLPLGSLGQFSSMDVTFDGADSIGEKYVRKGGGGCHLWEKLVAENSRKLVIVADRTKVSRSSKVALELIFHGYLVVASRLQSVLPGYECQLREGSGKMGPVISDSGNVIADLLFTGSADQELSDEELAGKLDSVCGVVEHGLFSRLNIAGCFIGEPDGSVNVL